MKYKELYIEKYDWKILVFFDAGPAGYEQIVRVLRYIETPEKIKYRIEQKVLGRWYDYGFTWSNLRTRETVIVLGPATTEAEFINSVEHEVRHLVDHIAELFGLEQGGEEVGYLTGEINRSLTGDIQQRLCSCGKPIHTGPCHT